MMKGKKCKAKKTSRTGMCIVPAAVFLLFFPVLAFSQTLKVQYRCADTNTTDAQIKPHLNIVNTGTTSVAMSELTVRYWYTKEGTATEQFNVDYAVVGSSNVTGSFQTGYLQVGFSTGAGSIAAGGQSGEIQIRINKLDWSAYNESDDWSFDATKTSFADWANITLYQNGTLIWGNENTSGTAAPTDYSLPTADSTAEVTGVPTTDPTSVPTDVATSAPTIVVTPDPTAESTQVTTPDPTSEPTVTPAPTATPGPTSVPTATPAGVTAAPTDVPTAAPTDAVTAAPTNVLSTDLFCKFRWGMNSGSGTTPSNIDIISIWVGYETDDGMNAAVSSMLTDVKNNWPNVTPAYYAYFIAFKASIHGGLGDCNTDLDGHNLCNDGAQWIRDNLGYILGVYDSYASMTASIWGTERPIIWLIEPDFIQYTYSTQTNPLTYTELAAIAEQIIDTVKARMPNAVISMYHATWTYGVATYWSYFNLAKIDMINTTGMADTDGYFNDGDAYNRAEATYSFLHSVTGKYILVDTSFGVTNQDNTWSNATAETLNARIAEGVFSALVEPPPDNYQTQIETLNPQLISPCN